MITKRRINIPIFNYRLLIIIYDKWEEVKDMHRGNVEPKAFTRIFPDGYSMVVINSKEEASIIHEAEHVKNAMMIVRVIQNCGIISRKTNYKGQVILPFIFLLILSVNNLLILLI